MGLEEIYREIHAKVRVEILDGTIEDFFANYLAENGRRIAIIGQLFVSGNIQFWDYLTKPGEVD